MRKIVALFLVLVMLFSLCACGSPEKKVVGTWLEKDDMIDGSADYQLHFFEDGTGIFDGSGPFIWELSENIVTCTYIDSGNSFALEYNEKDKTFITVGTTDMIWNKVN